MRSVAVRSSRRRTHVYVHMFPRVTSLNRAHKVLARFSHTHYRVSRRGGKVAVAAVVVVDVLCASNCIITFFGLPTTMYSLSAG